MTPQMPRIDNAPWALARTQALAGFMHARFLYELELVNPGSPTSNACVKPTPLLDLAVETTAECILIARALVKAYTNRIVVPWDADRYDDAIGIAPTGRNRKVEDALERDWRKVDGHPRIVEDPCIIVDMHGRILAWNLPKVLTERRQKTLAQATVPLSRAIRRGFPKADGQPNARTNWRKNPALYGDDPSAPVPPGIASMSPGWFEQGKHASAFTPLSAQGLMPSLQKPPFRPRPSATLNKDHATPRDTWIVDVQESSAILSAMLSIMHPELYAAGLQAMKGMRDAAPTGSHQRKVVDAWASVFTAVQVISQRETPEHRDNGSRATWYDILATIGGYRRVYLELPSIGLKMRYDPGSVVAIAGKILRHRVAKTGRWRICYAFFMRDKVHAALNVRAPHWMDIATYDEGDRAGPVAAIGSR